MSGYRILVIDDEKDLLQTLRHMLEGHEVFTAECANDALHILQEKKMDLLISDVNMPGMNGLQLLKFVKKHFPNIPVILISGEDEMSMVLGGCEFGAISCLTKPFRAKQLLSEVEFAVRRRRPQSVA